jgi:hypothetical protein
MLVKAMTTHNISQVHQVQQVEVCAICSHSNHTTKTCPMSSFTKPEHVNYVGQNNYPPRTTPTQILTMQGGEITPIFLGVAIRMF